MLVNFALTLPGRAPVLVVAFATWLAMTAMHAVALHYVNPTMIVAMVPALIAAGGGRLFGSLLDTAAAELADSPAGSDEPWYTRPLSTRFLLAVSLTIIALLGVPVLSGLVRPMNFRTPADWQVTVWMILSLLGWIGIAPIILRQRPLRGSARVDDAPGIRPLEFAMHVVIVATLAVLHTALIIVVSAVLAIPVLDHWHELAPVLFRVFAPLDLLVYLTILALGYASDVERQRRAAAQQLVENRLSALRARLNPHFLFNALNSVTVLARSGQANRGRGRSGRRDVAPPIRARRPPRRRPAPRGARFRAALPRGAARSFRRATRHQRHEQRGRRHRARSSTVAAADRRERGGARGREDARRRIGGDRPSTTGDTLRLLVADDGPGLPERLDREGVGLASTRERLNHLYGAAATLELARASDRGGTRVEITIPLQR